LGLDQHLKSTWGRKLSKFWTDEEYQITDSAYQDAVEKKARGGRVIRADIVDQCKRALPKRDPASISPHLGNLTSARCELGLAVLDEVAPFAHRPKKLISFLKQRYRLS
jgi:hypothetical protein